MIPPAIELDERTIADYLCDIALKTGAHRVHVIAHSMGKGAVLRAIDRIANDAQRRSDVRFGHFVLAAPDVDARKFKELCAAYRAVSQRTTLYVSSRDVAVGVSQRLHDFPCAMGQSAVEWAGIPTVYYGTSIPYLRRLGVAANRHPCRGGRAAHTLSDKRR